MRHFLVLFVFLVNCSAFAQTPAYTPIPTTFAGSPAPQSAAEEVKKGFRGLSVASKKVIWISGQKGMVGRSTDGGKNFTWVRVTGFEKLDFRTLHGFDKKNAVIATAGTPASILRTKDGGNHWKEVFRSEDSAMFFDGVGFWDKKRGLIFGDPIKGRMFLMETLDGGWTWNEIPFADRPQLVEGEAAFAASGTTIRTLPYGHVYIATGGVKSRLWHSRDYGHHWEVFETPILQGKPSQGIFSIAFKDTMNGVIVGGDYLLPNDTTDNCFFTKDGGRTWRPSIKSPVGYRSCVSWGAGGKRLIATGTSGAEYSYDDGITWNTINVDGGFNVVFVDGSFPHVRYYLVGGRNFFFAIGGMHVEDSVFDD